MFLSGIHPWELQVVSSFLLPLHLPLGVQTCFQRIAELVTELQPSHGIAASCCTFTLQVFFIDRGAGPDHHVYVSRSERVSTYNASLQGASDYYISCRAQSGRKELAQRLVSQCRWPASTGSCESWSLRTARTVHSTRNNQWHCSLQEDPHVLQSKSMEETYDVLAQRLLPAALTTKPGSKYLVGIAGPPGAGKSTVAQEVVARLNELWHENQSEASIQTGTNPIDIAVAVPMDGFHLYQWQLDAMEDPNEAHARRGAHWTFDPATLVQCLQQLRSQGCAHLPSFDHGVGDPIEKDIYVTPMHKVVVVEGNYLLLTDGEWKGLESVFDERWFVEVDINEAMTRVEKRHIATGKTPEIAKWRVVYNDRPNAELIDLTKWSADLIIPSISAY